MIRIIKNTELKVFSIIRITSKKKSGDDVAGVNS